VSQFGSPDVSIWCLIMVHQVMNDNISTPLQGFQQVPKVPFFVKNGPPSLFLRLLGAGSPELYYVALGVSTDQE